MVSGRLASGERLPPERKLAQDYGISRPVLREALRTLRERRLIEVVPGRGTFVIRPGLAQAAGPLELLYRRQGATTRAVIEARVMLECEAARLAAERADVDDVIELGERLRSLEHSSSVLERVRRDLAFHLQVVSASHNPVIETMFASIMRLSVELMLRSATDRELRQKNDPYHVAVYEAIKARDSAAAVEAMNAHLIVSPKTFGPDYEQSLEAVAVRGMRSLGYRDLEDFLNDVTTDPEPRAGDGVRHK